MNQIKKRLSIIHLAISITDIETIELQVLKLKLLKIDLRVEEIINLLQSRNYAQAQTLITKYIDTDDEKIIPKDRTISKEKPLLSNEDQAIIDEFQLFVSPTKRIRASNKKEEIDIDEFAPIPTPKPIVEEEKGIEEEVEDTIEEIKENRKPKVVKIDIDNLLKIEPEDIEPTPKVEDKKEEEDKKVIEKIEKNREDRDDNFFDTKESRVISHTDIIPKDTFFDRDDEIDEKKDITPPKSTQITPLDDLPLSPIDNIDEIPKEIEEDTNIKYDAIPNIGEKLLNLRKQFLSTDKSYENFATVEALVTQISQKGYTEDEIEETLFFIKKFVDEHRYSEASQLLLVCAATESKFAQLMLARELYKGVIVNKNIAESFLIIDKLAVDENAEALCDLGQFYENGIGVTKDKKKAEKLYKKSMDLGIKRAKTHYNRMRKANRSFFGRG